jgi:hypothetical protein
MEVIMQVDKTKPLETIAYNQATNTVTIVYVLSPAYDDDTDHVEPMDTE